MAQSLRLQMGLPNPAKPRSRRGFPAVRPLCKSGYPPAGVGKRLFAIFSRSFTVDNASNYCDHHLHGPL